tara:strand:+ start:1018 stop:2148 length:1131 start_codon:yes stop_codon:yes gene_type:complete
MLLNRDKMIQELIKKGLTTETLSLFNDPQIKKLYSKVISEIRQSAIMSQQADLQRKMENAKEAYDKQVAEIQKAQKKLQSAQKSSKTSANESEDLEGYSKEDGGTKTIDTDKIGNPDVDIKKNDEDLKLITDKKNIESLTNEMVEDWMLGVVNKKNKPLTKSKLVGMIKNIQEDELLTFPSDPEDYYDEGEYGSKKQKTKLFASVEQEYAFEQLNKYVLDLDGYQIMVDELEYGEDPEEAILNLFLASEAGFTWDIMIYTDGNIYMDGAPIQDSQDLEEEIREKESGGENWIEYDDEGQELTETERDSEGTYMGAPVGTEMPVKTPVRTPTTTPTTPKRRRGPFTRPKTTPKPKAGKKDMPNWMGFNDIKSQTENS